MLPVFLLERPKSIHVWKKRTSLHSLFVSYSALFFGSLTRCQQPQGYLCVFLLHTFCLRLVILQLKFSFCKEDTTPEHAANLMPWNCTFMPWQMRAGPCWIASSAIHIQWISHVLTLTVFNISSRFSINIELGLQEPPKGKEHPQFIFSGHFKSFW